MVNYANKDYTTSLSSASTSGITDGIDHVHSGILKFLENSARGNYIVDYNTASFQQVAGSTRTSFGFSAAINFFRDGILSSLDPTSAELASDPDVNFVRYDMIVIAANNALACRTGTAGAVPRVVDSLTVGDIPVALVEVVAGASSTNNVTNRKVQLYGYNKEKNGLSVGYSASNTYTQTLAVVGAAGNTNITATVADKNINFHGTDGTQEITALSLDMAFAGKATFNSDVTASSFTIGNASITETELEIIDGATLSTTELNYVDGVTSSIQSQLDSKTATVTSVTAGTGMTQTGTSTVNPTLNVIGGAGITASSNEILITDAGVTMAKLANIATDTFIGRTAANTGVPKALSKAEALAILNVADGANNYTHPDHSGDVTSNSDGATTIAADAVTYAKMQNLGTANRVLGSASTGLIGEVQIVVDMMTANSVDSAQYVDGSIDHEHLSGDCIDGDNIQDSVINSEHYANGSIDNEHLATGIDSVKIANGSVSNTEFQYLNGVTSAVQTQLDLKIKQGLHSIWIPAEAMTPRINAGCGALAATAAGNTNQPDFRSLPFDTSTQEYCQFSIAMPKMWNEGTIDVKFYWTSTSSSTSQNCVWEIRATAISDNETLVTNFGNATGAAQANSGAKILSILGLDTALTIGSSPAAGDICFFEVTRVVGSDDLATDALLLGVKLLYTINAENDA